MSNAFGTMLLAASNTAAVVTPIAALVSALIGFLIGRGKNRPALGAVLGLFLGFVGWIIIAVISKKQAPGV